MKYGYNFYQSQLRKDVNSSVFAKPCFEVLYDNVSYQVICKDKKILWITIVWYQVLGVHAQIDAAWLEWMKQATLTQAKWYYKDRRLLISLYIQFGFTTPLAYYDVTNYKITPLKQDQEVAFAAQMQADMLLWYGLVPSSKHNLPDATVVFATGSTKEMLWTDISKNTKEKIKKAERELANKLISCDLTSHVSDYNSFYELYAHTGKNKGFGAVGKRQRNKLTAHALEHWYGKLFVVRSWDRVVSGAFCIEDEDVLIYLYGGNDRSVGNKGYSQLLHWRIMQYAHEKWLKRYDMLGASRAWSTQDRLAQVTQFKMWFWGYKMEYLGSFDLILHRAATWIYRLVASK